MGDNDVTREPSRRRGLRIALSAVLTLLLVIGGSVTWLWWNQWRTFSVTVNGQAVEVSVNTSLATLLADNSSFKRSQGRLLSITGQVLNETGGNPAVVSLNNRKVTDDLLAETDAQEGDHIAVKKGTDVTETYTEASETTPHGVSVQLGAGTVQYVAQAGVDGSKVVWKGDVSGETVVHSETNPVDAVVTSRNPRPGDGHAYVALTFDDGPSQYTPAILDILKSKGVAATFFNVGTGVDAHPALEQRIVSEGHQIGNHTQDHAELTRQEAAKTQWEIDTAAVKITRNAGLKQPLGIFRAPYGSFNETTWQQAIGHISSNILWSVDTRDWTRPGATAITRSVLEGASNGGIILMHDGGGDRSQDVAALPGIIDGLKARGFTMVTVSELLRLDGGFPDDVVAGIVPGS